MRSSVSRGAGTHRKCWFPADCWVGRLRLSHDKRRALIDQRAAALATSTPTEGRIDECLDPSSEQPMGRSLGPSLEPCTGPSVGHERPTEHPTRGVGNPQVSTDEETPWAGPDWYQIPRLHQCPAKPAGLRSPTNYAGSCPETYGSCGCWPTTRHLDDGDLIRLGGFEVVLRPVAHGRTIPPCTLDTGGARLTACNGRGRPYSASSVPSAGLAGGRVVWARRAAMWSRRVCRAAVISARSVRGRRSC